MADSRINNHAGFIWSVADLLRGDYKQSEHGKVILPLTVLRRLDCVLEPTKPAVLARAAKLRGHVDNVEPVLCAVAGEGFYNTSLLDFPRLLDDPSQVAGNLRAYIAGFSSGAREVLDKFDFDTQITRLARADLLYLVLSRFAEVDLHPGVVSNLEMGYLYEKLVRRFSELSNETAGEHFTPREVIRLMVNLLFATDDDILTDAGVIKTGTTPPADQMERLRDGSLPWYSPGDVGDWLELQEPSRTLDREAVAQGWVPRFTANSTLIVGIGATAGSVAHLDCDGSGNQQMTCLVPGPRILPRFLSWQLLSCTEELRAIAPFTTLPILNNDFLKAASLFIPTIEEQAAIVGRLDELAKEMRRVVQLLERQVELLLEHRQALITAAVTGELDVAGVAA